MDGCGYMHNVKVLSHALQMVIKCADIGHLAADHTTHRQWSFKLEEEFFRQVLSVDCFIMLSLGCRGFASWICFFRKFTVQCIEDMAQLIILRHHVLICARLG